MPKRATIEFVSASEKKGICLQFGGEPYGLSPELWPKSKEVGEPMQFICQIPFGPDLFPGVEESVAYLFMTRSDVDGTWLPDGGENSLVILPRERITATTTVGDAPRICRMVKRWWSSKLVPQACVFSAKLTFSDDPEFMSENQLRQRSSAEVENYRNSLEGNKLGGSPWFIQGDELPFAEAWHLLLQLDSARIPFWINFGDAGVGYAFINKNGTQGKFLWQCL
ncbi:MAG: DUF1963 domain-containing protein [Verrucomicrobiota bacterium]